MTVTSTMTFHDTSVVLLDLDGTIVESGPGILAGLDHAFAVCGEPHPGYEVLRSFIGPPLSESFRTVLGMSESRAEQMQLAYSEHYLADGFKASEPYPGMRELITRLAADGRTVAVATNKPERTARQLLAHQGLEPDLTLIGGTDRAVGRQGKAAVIGSVLERLQTPAGTEAVMVGDRVHDAKGAAEHGIPAVLVGWGYGGEAERATAVPFAPDVPALARLLLG